MSLRKFTKKELSAILTAHSLWRRTNGAEGQRADLSGSNLSWSNLSESDLSGSDLSGSDLSWSDLSWSNLSGSNLSGSNLSRSDLSRSNLIASHFHRWNVYATSTTLTIGCHSHTWEDWKAHGKAYAKGNDCLKEFTEYWPVLDATRKVLQKRFPAKAERKGRK